MTQEETEEFNRKVDEALRVAQYNMLKEKAMRGLNVVISDGNGGVIEVPAKDLLEAEDKKRHEEEAKAK